MEVERENVGVLAQSCDMLTSIVDRFVLLLPLPSLSFVGLVFIDLLTPSQDDENRWLCGRRWLSRSVKRCEDALMFWRRREMMCRWNITLPCNDASSFVSKRRDKLKWIWLGAKAGSKDFLSTKLINSLQAHAMAATEWQSSELVVRLRLTGSQLHQFSTS